MKPKSIYKDKGQVVQKAINGSPRLNTKQSFNFADLKRSHSVISTWQKLKVWLKPEDQNLEKIFLGCKQMVSKFSKRNWLGP